MADVEEGDGKEDEGNEPGGVTDDVGPEGGRDEDEEESGKDEEDDHEESEKHGDNEVNEAFVLELLEHLAVVFCDVGSGAVGNGFDEICVCF